jgi:hypothetical protein
VTPSDPLPADLAAAHAMILAERTARRAAEARAELVQGISIKLTRISHIN